MRNNDSNFSVLCNEFRFSLDKPQADNKIRHDKSSLQDYLVLARANGLRITSTLTPQLFSTIEKAKNNLRLEQMIEAFVVADPHPNAYAPVTEEKNYYMIVFTSGLIDLLEPVVEYLTCPIAIGLASCSKMWLLALKTLPTVPIPLAHLINSPLLEAIPADSCPLCCKLYNPK